MRNPGQMEVGGIRLPPPAAFFERRQQERDRRSSERMKRRQSGRQDGRLELPGLELIERKGKSGPAELFLGRHEESGCQATIWVFPPNGQRDFKVRKLLASVRSFARLRSPHVARVLAVNDEALRPYFAIEEGDGWTARQLLEKVRKKGRQGLDQLASLVIFESVAFGLAEIHKLGVVHNDICPEHILVPKRAPGSVGKDPADFARQQFSLPPELSFAKLTHVGGVHLRSKLQSSDIPLASLGYIAPERLSSGKVILPSADVFSLGATLYCLLVGKPPFEGTPEEVVEKTLQGSFVPPFIRRSELHSKVQKLITRCLQKNPLRRFPNGQVLLKAVVDVKMALLSTVSDDRPDPASDMLDLGVT